MKAIFFLGSLLLMTLNSRAQKADNHPLSHLNLSLRISTIGIGAEAATPLHQNINIRAGINWLGYSSKIATLDLTDSNSGELTKSYGYVPEYKVKGELSFINGNILLDWHPVRRGFFHFTAGAYIGNSRVTADGRLIDPSSGERAKLLADQKPPHIVLDNYQLTVSEDALLMAEFKPKNIIKPYLGAGLGKAVTKSRMGFKFELGLIYQGELAVYQNGEKLEINQVDQKNTIQDTDIYRDVLKWWPILNLQLTYRMF
jgi:hypothetical protein